VWEKAALKQQHHDPGGKTRIPLPADVEGSAIFGGEREQYRYTLQRTWDKSLPTALFVMMNPSTAEPRFDDPSVARCRSFAKAWGYGTLLVGNTFAYRATDQRRLLEVEDPIGPENDKYLKQMARKASLIVFAYGKPHIKLRARGIAVARMLAKATDHPVYVLKLTADGTPSHPLYLPGNLQPKVWLLPEEAS
jgi:hypothetical protein